MPLSRLSNRSRRTGLKTKRRPSKQRTASTRHQHLWDAIRSTREELENWQAKAEYIQSLFRETILPREYRITEGAQQLTSLLISLLNKPARTPAERSLIGLWIIEILGSLGNHPFASRAQWENLTLDFSESLNAEDPIDSQLIRLLRNGESQQGTDTESFDKHDSWPDEEELGEEDIVFDFGWHKKEVPNADVYESEPLKNEDESKYDSTYEQIPEDDESAEDFTLDEKINSLENKLSIDRLFRQLAKVLHPDREQDEQRRAEKHLLMSECLEARQNKDIDKLLELYCEHVGELPDGITDDSHEELIAALELQLKQLQIELRQQRFGDALTTQIVERYADSDNSRTQDRISQHAKELDRVIQQNDRTIARLKTAKGIELALEERRSIELDRLSINEMTGYR